MANKIWDGTTDGVFTTAGNWVGGVAPVATDYLVFPAWATQNVDGSDQNATAFSGYMVEDGAGISVGSDETPLQLGLSNAATFAIRGSGSYHIVHNGAAGGTITGDVHANGEVELASVTNLLAHTLTISQGSGIVGIGRNKGDAAKIDTINMTAPAALTIGDGVVSVAAAAITTVLALRGTVACYSAVVTATIGKSARMAPHAAISTLLYVEPGGVVEKYGTGTLANVTLGGLLDADVDTGAFTISDMNVFGTQAEMRDTQGRATFTDGIQLPSGLRPSDVRLELDDAKKITLS